ncbi:MAG: MBL fold metallo-hydrolase [Chloroflexota bacterium]|nr:MBL fold metallo-hydrolase [Chloroflexota bacterium]
MHGSLHPDIMSKASVTDDGAVLLGDSFVCDAHAKRPVRIVTHAHWDHLMGIQDSLDICDIVLMSPVTKDIIDAIRGRKPLASPKVQTLDYLTPFNYGDEKVTFYDAGHILGSAQVVVQTKDHLNIVYTGDFKCPYYALPRADILIMEATYGNPNHIRSFESEVEHQLLFLIEQLTNTAPVILLGYHGKLQEVLQILSKVRIGWPIVLQRQTYLIARALEDMGIICGHYVQANKQNLNSLNTYVGLFHTKSESGLPEGVFKVYLSGWEFDQPIKQIGAMEYVVALSDHADFHGLVHYVEHNKPGCVITDNYRAGDATSLANYIEAKLGIPAWPMPEGYRLSCE